MLIVEILLTRRRGCDSASREVTVVRRRVRDLNGQREPGALANGDPRDQPTSRRPSLPTCSHLRPSVMLLKGWDGLVSGLGNADMGTTIRTPSSISEFFYFSHISRGALVLSPRCTGPSFHIAEQFARFSLEQFFQLHTLDRSTTASPSYFFSFPKAQLSS